MTKKIFHSILSVALAVLFASISIATGFLYEYYNATQIKRLTEELDLVADTATLGKPAGSDAEQGKNTYPSLLGLEKSREMAMGKAAEARKGLSGLVGEEADFLCALADYTVMRTA